MSFGAGQPEADMDNASHIATSHSPVQQANKLHTYQRNESASSMYTSPPPPPFADSEHGYNERLSEDDEERDPAALLAPIDPHMGDIDTTMEEIQLEQGRKGPSGRVTWMSLPRKDQLLILAFCRLVDFFQVISLQAYLFHQLKSFDSEQSDSTISNQAGILQGSFTAAQFVTAILWGRVADAQWGGRKNVLLIGLTGTALSCLGLGFSRSFVAAAAFRTFGGAINGTVGIIRTMISEIVKEKKFQSRAFLILPLSFNVAALFGPALGGFLADPVGTYPQIFGPHSALGGQEGIGWMKSAPYALPSLLSASILFLVAAAVFFCLEEVRPVPPLPAGSQLIYHRQTLASRKDRFDIGLHLGSKIRRAISWPPFSSSHRKYTRLSSASVIDLSPVSSSRASVTAEPYSAAAEKPLRPPPKRRLPFHRIFTRNVCFTLVAEALFDFHMG